MWAQVFQLQARAGNSQTSLQKLKLAQLYLPRSASWKPSVKSLNGTSLRFWNCGTLEKGAYSGALANSGKMTVQTRW